MAQKINQIHIPLFIITDCASFPPHPDLPTGLRHTRMRCDQVERTHITISKDNLNELLQSIPFIQYLHDNIINACAHKFFRMYSFINFFFNIPGWNDYVKEHKHTSQFSYFIWQ